MSAQQDEHNEETNELLMPKPGYRFVMKDGMDDPAYPTPMPSKFAPAWRQAALPSGEPYVVTKGRYFCDALDKAIISKDHSYGCWAPVAERINTAFREVYGNEGTKTPLSRMPECQGAFVTAATAYVNQWLKQTGQNTVEKRRFYRAKIQDLTWVRIGDLKCS